MSGTSSQPLPVAMLNRENSHPSYFNPEPQRYAQVCDKKKTGNQTLAWSTRYQKTAVSPLLDCLLLNRFRPFNDSASPPECCLCKMPLPEWP